MPWPASRWPPRWATRDEARFRPGLKCICAHSAKQAAGLGVLRRALASPCHLPNNLRALPSRIFAFSASGLPGNGIGAPTRVERYLEHSVPGFVRFKVMLNVSCHCLPSAE